MKKDKNGGEKNKREEKLPLGRDRGVGDAVPGINTPGIELPAFNPPVPNRAWTAMREGLDIEALSPEEKAELYLGHDDIM